MTGPILPPGLRAVQWVIGLIPIPWGISLIPMVVLLGCGSSSPADPSDRIPVAGTVKLDDKPVAAATVRFVPTDPDGIAASVTVVDGKFDLPQSAGPSSGQVHVLISPAEPEFEEVDAARRDGRPLPITHVDIPRKYRERGTIIRDLVPGQTDSLNFDLSSR